MSLFLVDRDGVINHDSPDYIKSVDEFRPIAGSIEALARLKKMGWTVCVVSNQSAIGRGLITMEGLAAIHAKLQDLLREHGAHIDGFFFCPHKPPSRCRCRKPEPGLLEDAAQRFDADLKDVPFVGDSLKDVLAAQVVNARPLLVKTGRGLATIEDPNFPSDVSVHDDLAAAVADVLGTSAA